jgi:hypothetical protein
MTKPRLTIKQILAWADAYHKRTGMWPTGQSEPVDGTSDETWQRVASCLIAGCRGLPRGLTLSRLLVKYRGKLFRSRRPVLTIQQILAWADAHHQRTGRWPNRFSGPVYEAPGEAWHTINATLRRGSRGLPAGSALRKLLVKYRGARFPRARSSLTIPQILAWAEEHRNRTGKWPGVYSGRVGAAPEKTWMAIDHALRIGGCGLPAGTSLARLLGKPCRVRKNKRNKSKTTPLRVNQILAWAKRHHELTGKLPSKQCGAVHGAPTEQWGTIDAQLRHGGRGLPGGSSLAKLLAKHLGMPYRSGKAPRPAP